MGVFLPSTLNTYLELTTDQTGTAAEPPNPKTRPRIGPKTPCTQDAFHRTL